MLGLNDTSTLVGHFVSSPSERENREEIVEAWWGGAGGGEREGGEGRRVTWG